ENGAGQANFAFTSKWVETINTQIIVTRTSVWDVGGTVQIDPTMYNPSSYNPSSYPAPTGTNYQPPLRPTETDDPDGVKITGGIIYPFPTGSTNGSLEFG